MNLLIYILLIVFVTIIAIVKNGMNSKMIINKESVSLDKLKTGVENKVPYLNILLISLILSYYSASLGTTGALIDRERYIYSFLIRYKQYFGSWDLFFNAGTEPGYLFLNMVIGSITQNSFWLFFTITFIFSVINLKIAYKMSKTYFLIILLMMLSMFFFQSLYLLKQALAVSFANIALLAFLEGRTRKYFIYSLVACTFHATAIILFPLYFLFKGNKSKLNYLIIITLFLFFFVFFGPILTILMPNIPLLDQFIVIDENTISESSGNLTSIFKGAPFYFISILALIKRKSLLKINDKADFYIIASLIYSFSMLATYNMYWFFRMGWYCLLPTLVLVPMLFGTVKNSLVKTILIGFITIPLIVLTFRQVNIILQ